MVFFIVVAVVLFALVSKFIYEEVSYKSLDAEDVALAIKLYGVWFLVCASVFPSIIKATDGFLPDYKKGHGQGIVVSVSNEGVIWKTNEMRIALGNKDSTAFEETVSYSIANSSIFDKANSLTGKRVEVYYDEWFFVPWRIGSSDRVVNKIKLIEEDE